jgi:MFS family permease
MPNNAEEEELRERYRELLEEMRTILPGVQVLFAFLLMAPFNSRFEKLDHLGRVSYTVALLLTALSAFAFIAPAAFHRLAERADRKARLRWAVRLQVSGLTILALAMTTAVFVVARFVFGTTWGGVLAGAVAGAAALLWYLVPIGHRVSRDA